MLLATQFTKVGKQNVTRLLVKKIIFKTREASLFYIEPRPFRILNSVFVIRVFTSHYSKCQIFVQKFNFDKKPNIFTSFSSKIFLTIFLVKSKLSTAKKSKTTTFSRVFHPEKSTIFSGNQS